MRWRVAGSCGTASRRRSPSALRTALRAGAEIVSTGDAASGGGAPGAARGAPVLDPGGGGKEGEEGNAEPHGEHAPVIVEAWVLPMPGKETRHGLTGIGD